MVPESGFKSGYSKRDLIYLLFKRKNQIRNVFLATLVLVVIGSYVSPRIYEAYSTLYVVRTVPPVPDVSASQWRVHLDRTAVLNSEADFIRSRSVAETVADQLLAEAGAKKDESDAAPSWAVVDALRSAVKGIRAGFASAGLTDPVSEREGLVGWLQSAVQATPGLQSDLITIRVRAPSGEYAANVVNLVTDAYLEGRLALMSRPGLDDFYEGQLAESRATTDRLEKEAQAIKDRIGVIDVEHQINLKLGELGGLERELGNARVTGNEVTEKIAVLRTQLSEAEGNFELGNEVRTGLKTELYQALVDLEANQVRQDSLRREVARLQNQLKTLDANQAQLRHLDASIASAERTYFSYLEQREQERITDRTDPGMTNVRVIHYAAVPAKPRFGRMTLITMGAGLGLLLGLAFAFASEAFDHTVNTREDVENYLQLPLIASVPLSDDVRAAI